MIFWMRAMIGRILRPLVMVLFVCLSTGFGKHPEALASERDIQRAPANTDRIIIGLLPLKDYPLLTRFEHLKDVDFYTLDGTGANDEKLRELSKLKFDQLEGISLLNCRAVTDEGIRHLSKIPRLKHLQLEGTSITDESLEIMASKMRLTGVNASNCQKVTMKGLLKLASSKTLKEFGFSADGLSQADVVRLLKECQSITWCGIVDPSGKLEAEALKTLGKEKGIRVVIKRTGALQDVVKGGGWR